MAVEAGQAIQMDFSGITNRTYAFIYDQGTLQTSGPTSRNYQTRLGDFGSDRTYSWKAADAGVYYILVRPYGSGYTSDTPARLTCTLVEVIPPTVTCTLSPTSTPSRANQS